MSWARAEMLFGLWSLPILAVLLWLARWTIATWRPRRRLAALSICSWILPMICHSRASKCCWTSSYSCFEHAHYICMADASSAIGISKNIFIYVLVLSSWFLVWVEWRH